MLCRDSSALLQGGKEGRREGAAKTAVFSSQESLEKATASKEGVVCMTSQRKLSTAPGRLEFGSKRRSNRLPAFPHLRAHLEGPWAQEGILVPGQPGGHHGDGPI